MEIEVKLFFKAHDLKYTKLLLYNPSCLALSSSGQHCKLVGPMTCWAAGVISILDYLSLCEDRLKGNRLIEAEEDWNDNDYLPNKNDKFGKSESHTKPEILPSNKH